MPTPFSFVQTAKLTLTDKVTDDRFATSVAIYNDIAVIGVPESDQSGTSAGAVYIFVRDDQGDWKQSQLLPTDIIAARGFFGTSVALNDTTILIGARGANNFSGVVYVFTRDSNNNWNPTQKLTPSTPQPGEFFGWSLALSNNIALIGARGNGDNPNFPGAAYLFTRDPNGNWTEMQKLSADDAAGGDEFGFSVALVNDTALIGAPSADPRGFQSGAAYLFARSDSGQWQQTHKFMASNGIAGDQFGLTVSFADSTAIIGAPFATRDDPEDPPHAGAVYVYKLQPAETQTDWTETQILFAKEGATGDEFGSTLAFHSDTLLIGAPQDDTTGAASGAVYLFALEQGDTASPQWLERQMIKPRDTAAGDMFGSTLAFHQDLALIGSPGDDIVVETTDEDNKTTSSTVVNPGSAYLLTRSAIPGSCAIKTDYDDLQCKNTFTVTTLADLDEYLDGDFGRKDNNDRYSHLQIIGSLTDSILDIHSPCEITIDRGVTLTGDFVSLDGRQGVNGRSFRINADRTCLLSETENVTFGEQTVFAGGDITLQAAKTATIGEDAFLTADGAIMLESTGDSRASNAIIDSGALVSGGSLRISAPRNAFLQEDSSYTIDGAIIVHSTDGEAAVKQGARIRATDLEVASSQTARLGKQTSADLSGNLTITSSGNSSDSHALIESGADLSVAGNSAMTSGNKITIDKKAHLTVEGHFQAEAGSTAQCKISNSAIIFASSQSGNCF
ncbi:MAG: hypothetical protein AB7G75_27770 [Candidatus Binatia bacterium]